MLQTSRIDFAEPECERSLMSENWPDLAGRLTSKGHILPIRIYFEDTDFSGVVYHANFLRFMERARSDMLRLLGVNHDALYDGAFGEPLAFAVRHIDITFLRPARIDDVVEVDTLLAREAGARLVLGQTVRRGSETLARAWVTVVMINAAGRARKLPAALRDKLALADQE
jgi:acyl-CoA thioester hydrolase